MSFQPNFPPSVIAKMAAKEQPTETGNRREDYKKQKELEEARKAGTAPAMQDEDGKDINPHIPQYIMQAPWFYAADTPTLRHQRVQPDQEKTFAGLGEWYKKGIKEGPVATKYRKGACENCGSITHKKKDCLERPRQRGAKFTNTDIAPDEYIPQDNIDMDFEGKRDRWNGYDMEDHRRVREEFQRIDEAKKELKAQKLDESLAHHTGEEDGKAEQDDDEKYAEEMDMPGQKFETKQRITVRNLRIREDTAKYLYNLDVNSAYYDPKTRSMRDNPFANTGNDISETPYTGDNFVRMSGDAMGIAQRQIFAWEAYEKGAEVHLQADPTKLEMLSREFKKRKEDYKSSVKDNILEKYGGEEHLEAPPKELLLAQTETYVEYSRHGTMIKGPEKVTVKSRYQEDIYINNHTAVWGSYWKDGQWGYKCCHSFLKESYCTGEAGKEAQSSTIVAMEKPKIIPAVEYQPEPAASPVKKSKKDKKKKKKKAKKKAKKKRVSSSSSSSSSEEEDEDEEKLREKRIAKAMKKLAEEDKQAEQYLQMDERKRPYNSMYDAKAPTEEELEAFKRRKVHPDDPMAQFF